MNNENNENIMKCNNKNCKNKNNNNNNNNRKTFSLFPNKPIGLCDFNNASQDACGVGFIANFKSEPSHNLVEDALTMLARMDHRGGCGCEPNTGDGAGVMIGMPHSFMVDVARADLKLKLPPLGSYAVGNVFLSKDITRRNYWKQRVEYWLNQRGMSKLGWRQVPTDNSMIGPSALRTEPYVEQIFVNNDKNWDSKKFDLELYVVKQSVSREAFLEAQQQDINPEIYICTLSSRTMVYKGQLTAPQVPQYYLDLTDPRFSSHFALVHSRFSTNTFPSWDRAHPNRVLCHNGEINTLRGNKNWMFAREGVMKSPLLESDDATKLLQPICSNNYSDSGNFDACLELLSKASDRSLPEAVMMMLPEAWQHDPRLDDDKRAFYEYNSCIMEPWDGPAMIAFADGRYLGCTLDRNGLRPHRYYVTNDIVVAASEVGVIPELEPADIVEKGRLMPGKMFLVDFARQSIVRDAELKKSISTDKPYRLWLQSKILRLTNCAKPGNARMRPDVLSKNLNNPELFETELTSLFNLHGFSSETIEIILPPMIDNKKEALGSMGVDTPLACLSNEKRLLYDYFKELFAQVTNPPMDSIREEIVMAMECPIGPEANLLAANESSASRLIVSNPVLTPEEAQALVTLQQKNWKTTVIDTTYPAINSSDKDLNEALNKICNEATTAVQNGATAIYLSDMQCGKERLPIPALLAIGTVHQHLIKQRTRTKVALCVEGGDIREVHHMCCLLGFGADAIHPYMAYEALRHLIKIGKVSAEGGLQQAIKYYILACAKGIRKVMGKIGISTVQSYKGAQIFEAVGIGKDLMDLAFTGTASRIGGIGLEHVHVDTIKGHYAAYPRSGLMKDIVLQNPGEFHYRHNKEQHYNSPSVIVGLQRAAVDNSKLKYEEFAKTANLQAQKCTLRGLLRFKHAPRPVPLEDVEPAREIVRRFVTGAMSFGSISKEAHETLAIAMNRIGAKSNTGEGGEDPRRFVWRSEDGDSKRSAIKQVASGRFGVTSNYLANSDEIQIKMAQGAKPGEGGELPGHKVAGEIPNVRKATEGVGLISPPPHHDIYSIEDLAQLIHDLKNANRRARISVKLVSEVGVGVIASGVAKAKADHIVVSGHDGGTGAAAWTGIKHAGLPWELGISETQQTLVLNNLRSRVVLQTDGQMKTGRDVAVAFLLGAEEVGFSTAPLIALGCIMMRKCHLNTCPVGIATQDPVLRAKFDGKPEYVINYLFMVAEEIRQYMSLMGFRTVEEMIGRCDMLEPNPEALKTSKLKSIDLSPLLIPAEQLARSSPLSLVDPDLPVALSCSMSQDHELEKALDNVLIDQASLALTQKEKVRIEAKVGNTNRTVGTMLSNEISKRFGENGLPDDSIRIKLTGSAGQSVGAFLAKGVTIEVEGDCNDYVGKGLSGGIVCVYKSKEFLKKDKDIQHISEQMIVGNVCLYGATSGHAYFSGTAGERFCVRNSGAIVVVEGIGDHGCEYMTGGRAIILGVTGRNFGAGMSGGLAYVYDIENNFKSKCNMQLIELETELSGVDEVVIRDDIAMHVKLTGSKLAQKILDTWEKSKTKFVKVFPTDLKRVLREKQGNKDFVLPHWLPESALQDEIMEGGGAGHVPKVARNSGKQTYNVMVEPNKTSSLKIKDIEDISNQGGCLSNLSSSPSSSSSTSSSSNENIIIGNEIKINKTSNNKNNNKVIKVNKVQAEAYDPNSLITSYTDIIVKRKDGTMGKINKLKGFVEYERSADVYRPVKERVNDYDELNQPTNYRKREDRTRQAARCMDCGTPFCCTTEQPGAGGCPISNPIPTFNQLYFENRMLDGHIALRKTNPFPEFTGLVCPAPCESSCVAGIVEDPVTIKNIEFAIIDNAWQQGWVKPRIPDNRNNKQIAIVGSGPAGLACGEYLNRKGYNVTIYERADRFGGLLMYGIPNMKLSKERVQKRVDLLKAEGIKFINNANVGIDPNFSINKLKSNNDALVLALGSTKPRDLPVPGRKLKGIHFAMDFLTKNTKTLLDFGDAKLKKWDGTFITAKGKHVVVIGGGDTGCDCIGTSVRHGCKSLVNLELLPKPPATRAKSNPWPEYNFSLKTDYGHAEVKELWGKDPREYQVLTKEFIGDQNGNVTGIKVVLVDWITDSNGSKKLVEIKGSEKVIKADLVLLALGFVHPETNGVVKSLPNLKLDNRGNIKALKSSDNLNAYKTSVENVYSCGDARRGQSLVVWAINEGIECGNVVDISLQAKVSNAAL